MIHALSLRSLETQSPQKKQIQNNFCHLCLTLRTLRLCVRQAFTLVAYLSVVVLIKRDVTK
jgi:hypothetical protein